MPDDDDVSLDPAEKGQTGVNSLKQADGSKDGYTKPPMRFFAWIGHQSLPRLLGLLVGNTRELEGALEYAAWELGRADAEIERIRTEAAERERSLRADYDETIAELRAEAVKRETRWGKRFDALADSVLMNRGMLPTTTETREMVAAPTQPAEAINSPRQIEVDTEADRLLELLQRGETVALSERIDDLVESGRPIDKRILQAFAKREAEQEQFEKAADIGTEVIIGPPEARVVS